MASLFPRPSFFVLTALLCAISARADEVSDILAQAKKKSADTLTPASAPAPSCTDGIATASGGTFCRSVADCRTFCSCACTFDPHQWKADVKNDGSTTCPNAPASGTGMLAPDSPDLAPLGAYRFITHAAGEKAATAARDGLQALDDYLAASPDRARDNYTVRVVSCYRPQLADTEPECGFVLKGAYMLARTKDAAQKKYWEEKSDPNNLGLAWPGRTPHSGGYACDLVLVDSRGQDSFDTRAGVDGAPTSSIPQRRASKLLDEAVTAAGGVRLNFEAWHYEWTTNTSSRCKDPDCADNHWPVTGKP